MLRPGVIQLFRSLLILLLIMSPARAAEEASLIVSVIGESDRPTWLGLIDLSKPAQNNARVVHLPVSWQARSEALPAGKYRLDHIDFSRTIAGDERTVRIAAGPEIELVAGVVSYTGDLILENGVLEKGEIRFILNWALVGRLCDAGEMNDKTLNVIVPGTTTRRLVEPCHDVNVENP